MAYRSITVKLEKENADMLKKICSLNKTQMSTFIREAILTKMNEGAISNIAGNNEIYYNPEMDNFAWKIKLDNGKEIELMDRVSIEFVEDLAMQINFQLKKREELLGKKNKKSVAVPKKLLRK